MLPASPLLYPSAQFEKTDDVEEAKGMVGVGTYYKPNKLGRISTSKFTSVGLEGNIVLQFWFIFLFGGNSFFFLRRLTAAAEASTLSETKQLLQDAKVLAQKDTQIFAYVLCSTTCELSMFWVV